MLSGSSPITIGSNMTKNREYLVHEPNGKADASVIWLHGLGASGNDFDGIVEQLALPINHRVRFVFPSAPVIPITINQGMRMRAWYDIYSLNSLHQNEDQQGITKSQELVEQMIADEMTAGIEASRIMLAGFSQGGAMSLYTGLRYANILAGIIVLSAYLPMATTFIAEEFTTNKNIPIFMAHGLYDPIVPYILGQAAYKKLAQDGYNIEWHSYPMQHTLCIEEINAIGDFIRRCFGYV